MTDADRSSPGARRPAEWVFDALLGIGVTLIVSVIIATDYTQTQPSGGAYVWAVGLGGLMLVRRRYPVLVVALSVVAVISYYAAGYPPIGVAVPLAAAVFSAAEFGRVAAAIVASVAMIVISIVYRLTTGQDPALVVGYELPGHLLLLAAAIALGDGVRSRRVLRRQAEEIAALVAERYEREAEQRVIAERLALARELHDSVGHALTIVGLHAQVVEEALGSDEASVRRSLRIISETTASTFEDVRRTVAGLRTGDATARVPWRLADLDQATQPAEQSGLQVRTRVDVHSPLSATVEAAIYRIVQEAVTNVVRHAGATTVEITVGEAGGMVMVTVEDDGAGGQRSDATIRPGNGITGMRERASLLGGTFSAGPTGAGFTVRATFPVEVTV